MKSDTSSEINNNILNGDHINLLKQTSDTDYHFDLIANQEKIFISRTNTSESDINNIIDSSEHHNINNRISDMSLESKTSKSSKSSKSTSAKKISVEPPQFIAPNTHNNKEYMSNLKYSEIPIYKPPEQYQTQLFNIPEQPQIKAPPSIPLPVQYSSNIPSITSNITPNITPININNLSYQELKLKKIEFLRKLSELKAKGYTLTKDYDFNSSLEEMEYEYNLLKSFADKRNGTKIYKNFILNSISALEFANNKYDPFDFELAGWTEHMSVEIDSYDDLIEELYEKYKGTSSMVPVEARLLFFIICSGAAYHGSKTYLGNAPIVTSTANTMLGSLLKGEKKDSRFMTPQELNVEKQKQMLRERERQQKQSSFVSSEKPPQMSQYTSEPVQFTPPPSGSQSRNIPEIKSSDHVQNILNRIKNINKNNMGDTSETQYENSTSNDRLVSEVTMSDNKRGKKTKKPIISINTR